MNNQEAFLSICNGVKWLTLNFIHATDKAAHRYPYAFIFPILLAAILISYVNIGKARIDRDIACKQSYEIGLKNDSLQCVIDALRYKNK